MLGKDHIGNCGSCWVRTIPGKLWIMLGKDHTRETVDHAG